MLTRQALAHETTEANARFYVQNSAHDPQITDSLHIQAITVAIGLTVLFCIFWLVTVFILYRLTRTSLLIT